MKIQKKIITKTFEYDLEIQSLNTPSHAIIDDYKNTFDSIVEEASNLIELRLKTLETIIESAKSTKLPRRK